MTQPNAVASFFTGGGKGITWPDQPGKVVSGTITAVHPPEPVRDLITGQPTDKQQIRIDLETAERDPEIEFDDGSRTLYVKSYMRSAIGDALKKVGEKEPKVGGQLTVAFVRLEPPERPGLNPGKIFEAQYNPPAVTGNFFGGGNGQQQQAAPQQYPNGMSATGAPLPPQQPQQQYAPPAAAPQGQTYGQGAPPAGANVTYGAPGATYGQPPQAPPQQQYTAPPQQPQPAPQAAPVQQQPGVPKPPSISDEAWTAMDENTRRTVASAVGAPPF